MLQAGRRLIARERIDQIQIASIAVCGPSFADQQLERWKAIAFGLEAPAPAPQPKPLEGEEARQAIFALFGGGG